MIRLTLVLFYITFSSLNSEPVDDYLKIFSDKNISINQNAMLVLGSWATANILIGTYGNFKTTGTTKYFHQFNVMWNLVNLGIASFGYFNSTSKKTSNQTQSQIIKDYNSLQNFLMLNAGLDIAYIIAGFYLKERAAKSKRTQLLNGYGSSLILQGAFLLIFDVSLFFIHNHNASLYLYPSLENLLSNDKSIGLGLNINF
jgi:hypothetical protein